MSAEKGKLYTCDRCGNQAFFRINNAGFLEVRNDWMHEPNIDLCPDCSKLYRDMIKRFMGDTRKEEK